MRRLLWRSLIALALLLAVIDARVVLADPRHARPRPVLEPIVSAVEPQYLPWSAGRPVHVNQGNFGKLSHTDIYNRYAWDFGLSRGDQVRANIPGTVVVALGGCADPGTQTCNNGDGNTIAVRVQDGTCARFDHLHDIYVKVGEQVEYDTLLGTAGSTGHSTAPHLHYGREDCATEVSLPSRFYEGEPVEGTYITSRLPVAVTAR